MSYNYFSISKKGAELSRRLNEAAIEEQAICMQAPLVWDAETYTDIKTAKEGCNGRPKTEDSEGSPPCPLRALCIETAIELKVVAGVWGGLTSNEISKLARKREQAELRKYLRNQSKR